MASSALNEFEKIFRQHHDELCQVAYNLTRDQDAAKDIVQEVFFKLWKHRDRVVMGDQIRFYLLKATSRTALNHLRSAKRLLRLDHLTSIETSLLAQPGTESIGYTELEHRVRTAIDRLPPKCRTIYLMSRQEGLSYQHIADALNLSLKTVENQMGIALSKLRKTLQPFITPELILVIATLAAMLLKMWSGIH